MDMATLQARYIAEAMRRDGADRRADSRHHARQTVGRDLGDRVAADRAAERKAQDGPGK